MPCKHHENCTFYYPEHGHCQTTPMASHCFKKKSASPQTEQAEASSLSAGLYGGMSPEYVQNMEKHRDILADALAEIKAASDSGDMGRVKEVVAGCILEIQAI